MRSGKLLVRLEDRNVAMFRFLLESYENLAFFTVLERRPVLLKIMFARESRASVLQALEEISASVPLSIEDWPISSG